MTDLDVLQMMIKEVCTYVHMYMYGFFLFFIACIYSIRKKECNKCAAVALISAAFRAPHLSLFVCHTFTLSLKVRRLVKRHNPRIAGLFL